MIINVYELKDVAIYNPGAFGHCFDVVFMCEANDKSVFSLICNYRTLTSRTGVTLCVF